MTYEVKFRVVSDICAADRHRLVQVSLKSDSRFRRERLTNDAVILVLGQISFI